MFTRYLVSGLQRVAAVHAGGALHSSLEWVSVAWCAQVCGRARAISQARQWRQYAQLEMRAEQPERVKNIFSRCLLSCYSVELWQIYLDFIQKVHIYLTCSHTKAWHFHFARNMTPVLISFHPCSTYQQSGCICVEQQLIVGYIICTRAFMEANMTTNACYA